MKTIDKIFTIFLKMILISLTTALVIITIAVIIGSLIWLFSTENIEEKWICGITVILPGGMLSCLSFYFAQMTLRLLYYKVTRTEKFFAFMSFLSTGIFTIAKIMSDNGLVIKIILDSR